MSTLNGDAIRGVKDDAIRALSSAPSTLQRFYRNRQWHKSQLGLVAAAAVAAAVIAGEGSSSDDDGWSSDENDSMDEGGNASGARTMMTVTDLHLPMYRKYNCFIVCNL